MKQLFYRLLTLLVLVAMIAAFQTTVFADAPAPDQQTAKHEIKYMENMIGHHAIAIMMTNHPDLISMCQSIIATQSAEIEMMQTWLQDWYGVTDEPKMLLGEIEGRMKMDHAKFEE